MSQLPYVDQFTRYNFKTDNIKHSCVTHCRTRLYCLLLLIYYGLEWQHTLRRNFATSIKGVVLERVVVHASNSTACIVASDPEVMGRTTALATQLAVESIHSLWSE